MNILIVYGSKYGNTRRLAEVMGAAIGPPHTVRVVEERDAEDLFGVDVDLLIVGSPTQIHGLHLIGRRFLGNLRRRAFGGVAAAAFDTRLPGPVSRTGAASSGIAQRLEAAGCRLVVPPESFLVAASEGPLAEGEETRAGTWARSVVGAATLVAV